MSEGHAHPDEDSNVVGDNIVVVDISNWIERARLNPQVYLERQATEIILVALSLSDSYSDNVFLKGGTLMGLCYGSPRQTADLDFTTSLEPKKREIDQIRAELDVALVRAAANRGYPDLICRVQSVKLKPKPESFEKSSFPALDMTIAYAKRGSREEKRLNAGQCPSTISADVSFNEPVQGIQIICLEPGGPQVPAYSLVDLIAEKIRALLQQTVRNRYRRQDVYDLALLIEQFSFDNDEKTYLLEVLLITCRSRNIEPDKDSISNPDIVSRAKSEWRSLSLELEELPDFDDRFSIVETFYRSLPWV